MLPLLWYNNLICYYSPIDTTSYYVTILLLIQQSYITILQLIQQLICSYNPTDTQSIIMLLFFHWYSKLPCIILLLTTYVTIPQLIQQTTMLTHHHWYNKPLQYYTSIDTASYYVHTTISIPWYLTAISTTTIQQWFSKLSYDRTYSWYRTLITYSTTDITTLIHR